MSVLQVQLFGDFQINYQGAPPGGFESPRLRSLLAFLLLHRDAPQLRKHIAFLFWQDSSEQQAHGNLRNLVHRLRNALPDADRFLSVDTQTLQWRTDAPFTLDVAEFQNLIADAGAPTAAKSVSHPIGESGRRVMSLSAAVALYRADLLPALYDEWLLPERERLRELFVDALAELIVLTEEAGEYQTAIDYARRLVQMDPLGEEAYRKLMQLYARTGDRAGVLRMYQTCVSVLKRELDTEPSAATRQAFEQLRHVGMPIERPAAPHIIAKANLPVALTSFIGRIRELDEIYVLLERARLVTLVGAGGSGKTRLAIEAAQQARKNYSDGVWFVDFAPLSDAADVPRAFAEVFGLREQAGVSETEIAVEFVGNKELLVVFDNCEHLLAACAALAHAILQRAPRVRIVATSRAPLNLAGEAIMNVPPLSLPDSRHPTLETLAQSEAGQLFMARAVFSLPTFALKQSNLEAVAQVCRRLDGIPLAIELAAARIRILSPEQIAKRLDDALAVLTRGSSSFPPRHQTMRAVLDWSDMLLAEPERVLFRWLSVFAGGFTLDAAERVCESADESGDFVILDLLSNLIDQSLVTLKETDGEPRYRMLEPIREYARDKLRAADETETLAARHLNYFLQLAEQAEPELRGPQQGFWLRQLEAEHDNLRAALSWRVQGGEYAEQRLRLAGALWRFWDTRGNILEGQRLLESALRQGAAAAPAARAKGYAGLGTMAWLRSDYEQAIILNGQALALYREIGDAHGTALALANIGGSHLYRAEYDQAAPYLKESLALARQQKDAVLLTTVLNGLGELARYQGDDADAQAWYEQARVVATEMRNPQQIALSLNNLGLVATRGGDFTRAIRLHQESLKSYRTGEEIRFVPECLEGLAAALHASGESEKAALFLGASDALRASIDLPVPPIDRQEYERVLARVRADLTDRFEIAWASGQAMTMEQAIDCALDTPN